MANLSFFFELVAKLDFFSNDHFFRFFRFFSIFPVFFIFSSFLHFSPFHRR